VLCILNAPDAGAHPGSGLVVNTEGEIFFTHGNAVIKVSHSGHHSVLVNDPKGEKFYQLHHLVLSESGDLLTASDSGTGIWRISQAGTITRHYPSPDRGASLLIGLGGAPFAVDATNNIFAVNLVDQLTSQILRLSTDGQIHVLAGGTWGHRDGPANRAQFGDLHSGSMVVHPDGRLLLTDGGQFVRSVAPDGYVRTLDRSPSDHAPDQGTGSPRFSALRGIAVDTAGNIFVADAGLQPTGDGRIYRIDPEGAVTPVAGGGTLGSLEGPAHQVEFTQPTGLAFGPHGDLYILEPSFPRIRKLTKQGQIRCLLNGLHADLSSGRRQVKD